MIVILFVPVSTPAHTQVRLNTELLTIHSRSPTVSVSLRPRRQAEDLHNPNFGDQDLEPTREEFDEIVLCTLADTSKRVLGKRGGWMEKWVLGNTKWSDDVTVTHSVSRGGEGVGAERDKADGIGRRLHAQVVHDRL